jgi:predicted AAA+ superfamily ATPase
MTAYNTKLISEITLYLRNSYHFLPGLLEVQEYLIRAGTPHLHNRGSLEKSLVLDIFTHFYIRKHIERNKIEQKLR